MTILNEYNMMIVMMATTCYEV